MVIDGGGFAASAVGALRDGGGDDIDMGFRTPGDDEGAAHGQAIDGDMKAAHGGWFGGFFGAVKAPFPFGLACIHSGG
ncbi:hypothetical protein GCM10007973_25370 [Polymorphobacter multimanifer]|nr:hypothetical protein GCM10007973_25370 [Polymorphobacter multimanifer]